MKKLWILIALLCAIFFGLSAQTRVLFDSSVAADLAGYDYIRNFEITSDSGYFKKANLTITPEPSDRGIRIMATNVPKDVSTNYKVLVAYPSFLNEADVGAGFISNAGSIKSIEVTLTTNRPYDEFILLYSTSPNGVIKEIKMPQDFMAVRSMEETTLTFDNPLYIADVRNRPAQTAPVLGVEADGLYLRGFKIKTNAPGGFSTYSPYSVFYIKKVAVVCDKVYTDDQLQAAETLKEEFGLTMGEALEAKAISDLQERNRVRDQEKELMATDE